MPSPESGGIWTIGHSTRSLEELVSLLSAHGIQRLVDVRTVPRSRRNPQFNRETLPESLSAAGIAYTHLDELGGLRRGLGAASPNTAWRNESFRGFADYMATPDFERGLEALLELAGPERIALMCAEAVPWRCHRSLIADALAARGVAAEHIMGDKRADAHSLTSFARVEETAVTYPSPSEPLLLPVRPPFRLDLTVRALRRLDSEAVNHLHDGEFRRIFRIGGRRRVVRVRAAGIGLPAVEAEADGPLTSAEREELAALLTRVLALDYDLEPFYACAAAWPGLATCLPRLAGLRPARYPDLWEAFLNTIPFQQITLTAAVTLVNRLVASFGARITWQGETHQLPPAPGEIAGRDPEEIRALGWSAAKARSLVATGAEIASGQLRETDLEPLPNEALEAALCRLPGIGRWSAQVIMLRGFGRRDVFPAGDAGAARALRQVFGEELDPAPVLDSFGETRGVLFFYLLGRRFLDGRTSDAG